MRALRIVAGELLRPILTGGTVNDMHGLESILSDISSIKTSHLWIDCVTKAVFIWWCTFVQRERPTGDYTWLQLKKCCHTFLLQGMSTMLDIVPITCVQWRHAKIMWGTNKFLKEEHVMRHVPGLWNGIWSDMFTETKFWRYGHGKRGIIGVTLKPETLLVWSLSLHICGRLEQDLPSFLYQDNDTELTGH